MDKILVLGFVILATMASAASGAGNNVYGNQKQDNTAANSNWVVLNGVSNGNRMLCQVVSKTNDVNKNFKWAFGHENGFMAITTDFMELETISIDPVIF